MTPPCAHCPPALATAAQPSPGSEPGGGTCGTLEAVGDRDTCGPVAPKVAVGWVTSWGEFCPGVEVGGSQLVFMGRNWNFCQIRVVGGGTTLPLQSGLRTEPPPKAWWGGAEGLPMSGCWGLPQDGCSGQTPPPSGCGSNPRGVCRDPPQLCFPSPLTPGAGSTPGQPLLEGGSDPRQGPALAPPGPGTCSCRLINMH